MGKDKRLLMPKVTKKTNNEQSAYGIDENHAKTIMPGQSQSLAAMMAREEDASHLRAAKTTEVKKSASPAKTGTKGGAFVDNGM